MAVDVAEFRQLEAMLEGHDVPPLEEILNRPASMKDALCRERENVHFFVVQGEATEPAKQVCRSCLVKAECLAFALETPQHFDHGVWGGTSPKERRRLRRDAA